MKRKKSNRRIKQYKFNPNTKWLINHAKEYKLPSKDYRTIIVPHKTVLDPNEEKYISGVIGFRIPANESNKDLSASNIVAAIVVKAEENQNSHEKQSNGENPVSKIVVVPTPVKGKQIDSHEEPNNKKRHLLLIPLFLGLVLGLGSCKDTTYIQKIESTRFETTLYRPNNAGAILGAVSNRANQEAATNALFNGTASSYGDGSYAARIEDREIYHFNEWDYSQKNLDYYTIDVDHFVTHLDLIAKSYEDQKRIYDACMNSIEVQADKFKEEAQVKPDSRTSDEGYIVDDTVAFCASQQQLAKHNLDTIQELQSYANDSDKKLVIDSIEEQLDGDKVITGTKIKTMIKKQEARGIEAAWIKLCRFFKNLVRGNDR